MHILMRGRVAALVVIIGGVGCTDSSQTPSSVTAPIRSESRSAAGNGKHLVLFSADETSAGLEERAAALGAGATRVFGGAGLATVSGLTDAAATELARTPGVSAVERDFSHDSDEVGEFPLPAETLERTAADVLSADVAGAAAIAAPAAATYYPRQWNLRAIGADKAWDRGEFGSPDVRVFILDTGIDYTHPDLAGLVDASAEGGSVSLLSHLADPGNEEALALSLNQAPILDFHSHGTSVASLIASNGALVAGVTRNTRLYSVKVHDRRRTGDISVYVEGIIYAADHGADVIHLSIGMSFSKHEHPGAVAAINKATSYAHRKGAVIVAAAGNAMPPALPTNFDADGDSFKFCNAVHVICVSATAPTSTIIVNGLMMGVNPDTWAPYSFYGRSTITVTGPGGGPVGTRSATTAVPVACSRWSQRNADGAARCSKNPVVNPIGTTDAVWYSTGTTFVAAATSGLAALLVSKIGHGQPDKVAQVIVKSADDLGQSGNDPYFGRGRINVVRALDMLKEF